MALDFGNCLDCGADALKITGKKLNHVECGECGAFHRTKDVRTEYDGPEFLNALFKQSKGPSEEKNSRLKEKGHELVEHVEEREKKRAEERRKRENVNIEELTEDEIAERVSKLKAPGGAGLAGSNLLMIGIGALLSITVIGAIIGIPMIIIGVLGLFGSSIEGLGNVGENAVKGSPWDGTGLKGIENREHRKANKTFEYQCPNCGLFAGMRKVPEPHQTTIRCSGCDAVYQQKLGHGKYNEKTYWRMIEGESDRLGEIHKVSEWHGMRREQEPLPSD